MSRTWREAAVLATLSLRPKRAVLRFLSRLKVVHHTDEGPTVAVTPWRFRLLLEETTESSEGSVTSKRRSLMLETVLFLAILTEAR